MTSKVNDEIVNEPDPLKKLILIMARLRDPDGGCPWDIEQDFSSIAPHTVEEAYEVADAIERNDVTDLKEELGDLLLQVVFHSQIAQDKNLFTLDDVASAIADKLIFRHPHVFGDETALSASDVVSIWDAKKDEEKKNKSAVGGVTLGLPALLRAQKLQKKAGKAGFVWPDLPSAWAKLEEELAEFKAAENAEHQAEELGDLLFCIVNYARLSGHDCENILAKTNQKFERRFAAMEQLVSAGGQTLADLSLEDMLAAWRDAKTAA